jgi:hypothetical protein
VRLRRNRPARHPEDAPKEKRTLLLVLLITLVPLAVAAFLIAWSIRPDLYDFVPETEEGAPAVSWRTLDALLKPPAKPMSVRPDLFGPAVRLAGYMTAFDESSKGDCIVTRFLLIPNPGTLLHPPHLGPGQFVRVRLKAGGTTRLMEREAVLVRGILSVQRELRFGRSEYHLLASRVQSLDGASNR